MGINLAKASFDVDAKTIRDLGESMIFSIIGRHLARAEETYAIAKAVEKWLDEVKADEETFTSYEMPNNAEGYACTEAPRGSLMHYTKIRNGKIDNYQMLPATIWNCCPRDDNGRRGPVEEALIGVPVPDAANPVNVGRLIRAFDP
jgi:hydrogenase large subunit